MGTKNDHSAKRLLFIAHTDNLRGGGELSLIELLKGANKRGYNANVVVPARGEFYDRIEALGFNCQVIRYFWWGRPYSASEGQANLTAVSRITHLAKQLKVDAIITNTLTVPWGALAASTNNLPHVWICREYLNNHHAHLSTKYEFIDAFSNLVMSNSKSNTKFMREQKGLEKTKQFYSYIDTENLKLAKSSGAPRVVCIGRLHEDKNQLEVVRALRILKEKYKQTPEAVFIGAFKEDDAYFKKIQDYVKKHDLHKQVTCVGFKENPYSLVAQNDILVQPSKMENLGRTIVEAMKLGLICVGADIADTKEAFDQGGGSLYPLGDYQALAETLANINKNYDKYLQLAKDSQKRALANFSEESCHDPFFINVDNVLGDPNPRKELGSLSVDLDELSEAVDNDQSKLQELRDLANRHKRDIENIVNSRSWKLARLLRKFLGR